MPVVLTGAASHWAACTAWADRATFEARLGGASRELPCLHSSDNRRFASVTSAPAASSGGHSSSCSPHSVAEVLAAVHADGGPRMQVQLAMDEALLQDVEAIDGLPVGASESPEPANSVWLCSGGTETPLHFEERHGTFVQVVGCTRLVVFPPDEHPRLYPFSAHEGDPFASRVDLSSWRQGDPSECFMWPRLARSRCLEATLQPGDAAYIPAGYWYHQTALSPSVAVRAAFDMSRAEQRTQARPWALPCWGRASLPIVGPTGLSRAILLPSTESDDLQRRLGAGVWASAFVLADELLQGDSWQQVLCGARVLELGAGATGYPGMVAALRGGASTCVMLTDKHSDLVDGLRQVLDDNGLAGQCAAEVFDWGAPTEGPSARPFDIILASDCLYSHDTAGAFCDALNAMSGEGTRILVSAEERWSRSECIEIAADQGWVFTQLGGERRPSQLQLDCVERRYREMGEGRCYVYAVTRARGGAPRGVGGVGVADDGGPGASDDGGLGASDDGGLGASDDGAAAHDDVGAQAQARAPVEAQAQAQARTAVDGDAAPVDLEGGEDAADAPATPVAHATLDERFSSFLLDGGADATFRSAAARLLSSQYVAEQKEWVSMEGSYTPLSAADCTVRHIEPCAACFEEHIALALPDSPPPDALRPSGQDGAPPAGVTEIHRFVLHAGIARHVNEGLEADAAARYAEGGGIRRSNVGGFHSDEEVFSGSSSDWYGRLHNVLLEALRMLEPDPAAATSAQLARMRLTGWLNMSTSYAFNTLHDHGDAVWAAVYFVDAGKPVVVQEDESAAVFAGALLLKTQFEPWASRYGYLPITPRPGDLWIIPGYVPHAVLPRALPRANGEALPVEVEAEDNLRISVACNVKPYEVAKEGESTGALRVVRHLLKNM